MSAVAKTGTGDAKIKAKDCAESLSIARIEKLLLNLKIFDFKVLHASKTILLRNRRDLTRILVNLCPFERVGYYLLQISESANQASIQVGSWQFEVRS